MENSSLSFLLSKLDSHDSEFESLENSVAMQLIGGNVNTNTVCGGNDSCRNNEVCNGNSLCKANEACGNNSGCSTNASCQQFA